MRLFASIKVVHCDLYVIFIDVTMEAMEMTKNILIKNIKNLRDLKGWTQEDLAEEAGYSTGFIKDIERGKSWVSPEALEAIAEAFNVHIGRLFEASESKEVTRPVSVTLRKMLNVPDRIYDIAEKLGPKNDIWENEIIPLLEAAVEDEELLHQKKTRRV